MPGEGDMSQEQDDLAAKGEQAGAGERERSTPSFMRIQRQLERGWATMPKQDRTNLLAQRQTLVDEAEREGLFGDARVAVPGLLRNTQWNDLYAESLRVRDTLERSASKYYRDNPEWAGMVETAIEGTIAVTLRNGILNANPGSDWHARHYSMEARQKFNRDVLTKNIVDLGTGDHPDEMVATKVKKERVEAYEQPRYQQPEYAGTMTVQDKIRAREEARKTQNIPYPDFTYRSQLVDGAEALSGYNLGESKEAPLLLQMADIETQLLWQAGSKLSMAASHKLKAPGWDKMFDPDAAATVTREDLKQVIGSFNVLEATSLYTHIIVNDLNPREVLLGAAGSGAKLDFDRLVENVRAKATENGADPDLLNIFMRDYVNYLKDCPESIYEIKDTTQLNGLRVAMRYWLMMNRPGMRLDLTKYTETGDDKLTVDDARLSEVFGWMLVYQSNIIEENDSRFSKAGKEHEKRMSPVAKLKALNLWMMMHPQERLEGKIDGSIPEPFGAFGLQANYKKKRNPGWSPKHETILPDFMFKSNFTWLKEEVDGKEKSLTDLLNRNGEKLVHKKTTSHSDLLVPTFATAGNTPFSLYQFDIINSATKLFTAVVYGENADVSTVDMGIAFGKLDFANIFGRRRWPIGRRDRRDEVFRDNLLRAKMGINTTSLRIRAVDEGKFRSVRRIAKNKGYYYR